MLRATEELCRARVRSGLSWAQIARKAGCTELKINRMLNNGGTIEFFARIAWAMGFEVKTLLERRQQ